MFVVQYEPHCVAAGLFRYSGLQVGLTANIQVWCYAVESVKELPLLRRAKCLHLKGEELKELNLLANLTMKMKALSL